MLEPPDHHRVVQYFAEYQVFRIREGASFPGVLIHHRPGWIIIVGMTEGYVSCLVDDESHMDVHTHNEESLILRADPFKDLLHGDRIGKPHDVRRTDEILDDVFRRLPGHLRRDLKPCVLKRIDDKGPAGDVTPLQGFWMCR